MQGRGACQVPETVFLVSFLVPEKFFLFPPIFLFSFFYFPVNQAAISAQERGASGVRAKKGGKEKKKRKKKKERKMEGGACGVRMH